MIDDQAVMKEFCGYQGSRAILFCIDYTRLAELAAHVGHTFEPDGFVAFVTGSIDAVLAAQTAAIADKSLGIDSLFTNGIHRAALDRVYQRLNLPSTYCFPLNLLVLGYPTGEPEYQRGRLEGEGIIHHGQYHHLTTAELDQMVTAYDDPEKHLGLNPNWRSGDYTHYLDWFFTAWSGHGFNPKEREFAECLSRAGFIPEEEKAAAVP